MNKANLKRYEFMPWELSEIAFDIYSHSDMVFYYDTESKEFWYAENQKSDPIFQLENISKVNDFLEGFLEEEEIQ